MTQTIANFNALSAGYVVVSGTASTTGDMILVGEAVNGTVVDVTPGSYIQSGLPQSFSLEYPVLAGNINIYCYNMESIASTLTVTVSVVYG